MFWWLRSGGIYLPAYPPGSQRFSLNNPNLIPSLSLASFDRSEANLFHLVGPGGVWVDSGSFHA